MTTQDGLLEGGSKGSKVSLAAARRFCAQWHRLFEFSSPSCIRLRTIVSPKNSIRKQQASDPDPAVAAELAALSEKDAAASATFPHFMARVESNPERAAALIAYLLASRGHDEKFLVSLETDWAQLLLHDHEEEAHQIDYDRNRIVKFFDVEQDNLDLTNFSSIKEYTCYFVAKTPMRSGSGGSARVAYADLPEAVAEVVAKRVEDYPTRTYFAWRRPDIDSNCAVWSCIDQLEKSSSKAIISSRAQRIRPLYDFDEWVMVVMPGGSVIRFNWKKHRSDRRGSFIDLSPATQREKIEASESFLSLISAYSNALKPDIEDDTSLMFDALVKGIDSLFRPLCGMAGQVYTQRVFVSVGAKFLAMQYPHATFEACHKDVVGVVGPIRSMKVGHISNLPQLIASLAPASYVRERAICKAHYLSKMGTLQGAKTEYSKNYIKSWLDLNHIRIIRNSLVHTGSHLGGSYYTNILLSLFRSVLAFRIACLHAYDELGLSEKNEIERLAEETGKNVADVTYALTMRLLLQDAAYLLGQSSPGWIRSDKLSNWAWAGWGGWAAGRSGNLLAGQQNLFEAILSEKMDLGFDLALVSPESVI